MPGVPPKKQERGCQVNNRQLEDEALVGLLTGIENTGKKAIMRSLTCARPQFVLASFDRIRGKEFLASGRRLETFVCLVVAWTNVPAPLMQAPSRALEGVAARIWPEHCPRVYHSV